MDFRGKVWCISPNCKGKCKRKLTDQERTLAAALGEDKHMNYAYHCGFPDDMAVLEKVKAKFGAALQALRIR